MSCSSSELREVVDSVIGAHPKISTMQADIVVMQADIVEMKADIVEMKADIVELKSDVKSLKVAVKNLENTTARLEQRQDTMQDSLDRLEANHHYQCLKMEEMDHNIKLILDAVIPAQGRAERIDHLEDTAARHEARLTAVEVTVKELVRTDHVD